MKISRLRRTLAVFLSALMLTLCAPMTAFTAFAAVPVSVADIISRRVTQLNVNDTVIFDTGTVSYGEANYSSVHIYLDDFSVSKNTKDSESDKYWIRSLNSVTVSASEPNPIPIVSGYDTITADSYWVVDDIVTNNINLYVLLRSDKDSTLGGSSTEYTITLNPNGGTLPEGTTNPAKTTGGKLATLPEPTRTGYTFGGWYKDPVKGPKVDDTTSFDGNATIYAQWLDEVGNSTDNKRYVTYLESVQLNAAVGDTTGTKYVFTGIPELNKAEIAAGFRYIYAVIPRNGEIPKEVMENIAANNNNNFEKKGYDRYTFVVSPSMTMQDIPTDNTITVPTLSAVKLCKISDNSREYSQDYKQECYNIFAEKDFVVGKAAAPAGNTIKLNANGGNLSGGATATTNANGCFETLPTAPTYDGYTFGGWYTEATKGTQVTTSTQLSDGATIYAQWLDTDLYKPTAYLQDVTLTHVENDNTGTVFEFKDLPELTQAEIDDGFKYVCMVLKNADANKVNNVGTSNNALINQECTRKYFGLQEPSITNITDNQITIEGTTVVYLHKINKKYCNVEANNLFCSFASKLFAVEPVAISTEYTITFDPNRGTLPEGTTNPATTTGGKLTTLPKPTRTDFVFNGWYTDATNGTPVTTETTFEANATIYAQWTYAKLDNRVSLALDEVKKKEIVDKMIDGKDFASVDVSNLFTINENSELLTLSAFLTDGQGNTSGKYTAGEKYYATVTISPKSGYTFEDINNVKIYLEGIDWFPEKNASENYVMLPVELGYADYEYEDVSVDKVQVNVDTPNLTLTANEAIDGDAVYKCFSVPNGVNYNVYLDGIAYKDAEGNYVAADLDNGDTYAEGKKYYANLVIALPVQATVMYNYYFAENVTITFGDGTIPFDVYGRSGAYIGGYYPIGTVSTAEPPENKAEKAANDIDLALDSLKPTNDTVKDDVQAIVDKNKGETTATVETFELTPATEDKEGSLKVTVNITDGTNKETVEKTYTIDKLPKHEHKFGAWTVVKEATATEEGLLRRTCTVEGCTEVEEKVIPKLEESKDDTDKGNVLDKTPEDNDFSAELPDVTDTAENIPLDPDESAAIADGSTLSIFLKVTENLSEDKKEDEKAITDKADSEELTIGSFLDVSLFKQIGDNTPTAVTETKKPIKVSFIVPDELVTDGRAYYIIRTHGDETTIIECEFDPATKTCTFETDKFSSYAIAFKAAPAEEDDIEKFVERLYLYILGRHSDPEGKADHVANLRNGKSAVKVGFDFVFSDEFRDMDLTNEERAARLYLSFLDREPEADGLASWTAVLDGGCSVGNLFHGFTQSKEFGELCEKYGIVRGEWKVEQPRDVSPKLTAFVSRLYTKALNRGFDVNGLNNHTANYIENHDVYQLAYDFIFSPEFLGKELSDEDFVDTMYRTFFDREGDPKGRSEWIGKLKSGMSREEVLAGFVGSQECNELVEKFGI